MATRPIRPGRHNRQLSGNGHGAEREAGHRGDGVIDGGDWVQLGRYVVGLDPLQNTGGPSVTTAVRYYGLIANTLGPLIVIAIPFAVSGVRVNPAVGVSKSIGLFFLYYLLTNFSESLAMNENVGPVVAAWLPNIGMILLAGLFFARLR